MEMGNVLIFLVSTLQATDMSVCQLRCKHFNLPSLVQGLFLRCGNHPAFPEILYIYKSSECVELKSVNKIHIFPLLYLGKSQDFFGECLYCIHTKSIRLHSGCCVDSITK